MENGGGQPTAVTRELWKEARNEAMESALERRTNLFLRQVFSRLVKAGASRKEAKEVIKEISGFLKESDIDKRFGIPNVAHLRKMLKQCFQLIVQKVYKDYKRPHEQALSYYGKKFGLLFFDAEGLKSLNYIFGRSTGDRYLNFILTRVSPHENMRLAKFLNEYNLDVTISSAAEGDEFILLVYFKDWKTNKNSLEEYGEKNGKRLNLLEEILVLVQQDIEVVDLSIALGINLNQLSKKLHRPIPVEYRWYAAALGGYCTLAISDFIGAYKQERIADEVSPGDIFVDAVIDTAEAMASKSKEAYKSALEESLNEHDNITGMILTRNEQSSKLFAENIRLKKKLKLIYLTWLGVLILGFGLGFLLARFF